MKWYQVQTGQFGYPYPKDDFGYQVMTYDPSQGCSTCEIGKVQRAPFRFFKEPKITNKAFIGLNWIFDEVFTTQAVRQLLEKEGLSGMTFSSPVVHKTNEKLKDWCQMHVNTVLPPAILTDGMTTETCAMPADETSSRFLKATGSRLMEGPFCGHEKLNWPQGTPLAVRKSALTKAPDVVRTSEWFGSGGSASQAILVSERFFEVIRQNKLRGLFFDEVKIL
ncbi:hypothetical protein [Roseobacter sp. CCS2]|uniref:hypothetical protein n=1 Tax=Roseobacter sp. CCS2 TaxID=391593 RepID=UPI0000F400BB|nr:hypothetical protein [Roseobacter sp. CCS2]EBA12914.1 hypothetical protein RCCS2_03494 [Roseobacter sp. CCS2]